MAKLFKIEAYFVDANNNFKTADDLADFLSWRTEQFIWLKHAHVDMVDMGEWHDEHPINYVHCPESEFEKYFKENNYELPTS